MTITMASGDRYTTTLVGAPGQYYHPTTSLHGHAIHLPYYAILSPHCLNYSSIILVVTYAIRYTCSLSQHQGVWGIFSASSKASGQVYMAFTIHFNLHRCVCLSYLSTGAIVLGTPRDLAKEYLRATKAVSSLNLSNV